MVELSWQSVVLAAINVAQIVFLAYINARSVKIERHVDGAMSTLLEAKTTGRPKP